MPAAASKMLHTVLPLPGMKWVTSLCLFWYSCLRSDTTIAFGQYQRRLLLVQCFKNSLLGTCHLWGTITLGPQDVKLEGFGLFGGEGSISSGNDVWIESWMMSKKNVKRRKVEDIPGRGRRWKYRVGAMNSGGCFPRPLWVRGFAREEPGGSLGWYHWRM